MNDMKVAMSLTQADLQNIALIRGFFNCASNTEAVQKGLTLAAAIHSIQAETKFECFTIKRPDGSSYDMILL